MPLFGALDCRGAPYSERRMSDKLSLGPHAPDGGTPPPVPAGTRRKWDPSVGGAGCGGTRLREGIGWGIAPGSCGQGPGLRPRMFRSVYSVDFPYAGELVDRLLS